MRLSIIGTAGRKDDRNRLNKKIYTELLLNHVKPLIEEHEITELCSGGAAWMDHLAVSAFLMDMVPALSLHLPAPFENGQYVSKRYRDAGSISNYYHKVFSEKMGGDSLDGIARAIKKGAEVTVHDGFFSRNNLVGSTDVLSAYTFGTHSGEYTQASPGWSNSKEAGLKNGGTAHTWNNSKAPLKVHTEIYSWSNRASLTRR